MRRHYLYVLLLLLTDCLPSCTPGCGPDADQEPRLTIYFSSASQKPLTARNVVTSIQGIDGAQELRDPTRTHPTDLDQPTSSVSYNVPYSLAADQTRYVLTSATRFDTLTVNYRRIFSYKDDDCGYWVDVQPPIGFTNPDPTGLPTTGLGARSTLGKVTSVYYEGTRLDHNVFNSRYTRSDITVSITLP